MQPNRDIVVLHPRRGVQVDHRIDPYRIAERNAAALQLVGRAHKRRLAFGHQDAAQDRRLPRQVPRTVRSTEPASFAHRSSGSPAAARSSTRTSRWILLVSARRKRQTQLQPENAA